MHKKFKIQIQNIKVFLCDGSSTYKNNHNSHNTPYNQSFPTLLTTNHCIIIGTSETTEATETTNHSITTEHIQHRNSWTLPLTLTELGRGIGRGRVSKQSFVSSCLLCLLDNDIFSLSSLSSLLSSLFSHVAFIVNILFYYFNNFINQRASSNS